MKIIEMPIFLNKFFFDEKKIKNEILRKTYDLTLENKRQKNIKMYLYNRFYK